MTGLDEFFELMSVKKNVCVRNAFIKLIQKTHVQYRPSVSVKRHNSIHLKLFEYNEEQMSCS